MYHLEPERTETGRPVWCGPCFTYVADCAGPQFEGEATPGNLASKTVYGVLKEPGVVDLNSSLKVLTVCVPLPEGEY